MVRPPTVQYTRQSCYYNMSFFLSFPKPAPTLYIQIHGASLEPISIDLERREESKNKYSLSNNVTMASKTERSSFEEAPPSFICCVGTFWFQCSMLEWWEISLRLCVWFVCVCVCVCVWFVCVCLCGDQSPYLSPT